MQKCKGIGIGIRKDESDEIHEMDIIYLKQIVAIVDKGTSALY